MRTILIVLGVLGLGCSSQPTPEQAADGSAPGGAASAAGKSAKPAHKAAAPAPVTVTLPEGTVLKVRTTSALSTKTNRTGDTFEGSLEEPIEAGGRVAAPRGARVLGTIVESDPGGRVKGLAAISLRLTQLEVSGGKMVDVETDTVAREARSTHKQDAAKIGIGAAAGAAIGAIAGGGKGAAIGAASGGGAGTGLVLATRGEPAVVPAESVLRFELRAPVRVAR